MINFSKVQPGQDVWLVRENWTPKLKASPVFRAQIVEMYRKLIVTIKGSYSKKQLLVKIYLENLTERRQAHQLFYTREEAMVAAREIYDREIYFADAKSLEVKEARRNIDLYTEEDGVRKIENIDLYTEEEN